MRGVLVAGVSMVEDDAADADATRGLRLRVLPDATSAEPLPFAPPEPDPFSDRAIQSLRSRCLDLLLGMRLWYPTLSRQVSSRSWARSP